MMHQQRGKLFLSGAAWKAILLDAYGRGDIEACGVLLGRIDEEGNWYVAEARGLRNIFASPVYFEFDPAELLTIELEQPGRVVGVYHSHPGGPARASSTDRQNMRRVNLEQRIPWAWLIVSGPFSQVGPEEESSGGGEEERARIITTRGVIAYHHYQRAGLQSILVVRDEKVESA